MPDELIIFTDLDGCLLNKSDYSYTPSLSCLAQIRELRIPLILCSSKTAAEMRELRWELELADYPMTCENGGVIDWSEGSRSIPTLTAGAVDRDFINECLAPLKSEFRFRSFRELGTPGIMEYTDLPPARAAAANARVCSEPLRWEDTAEAAAVFAGRVAEFGLTATRGGRFLHVAGQASKGTAMLHVAEHLRSEGSGQLKIAAIGDSPIDQSMLDAADIPIGIPQADGLMVTVDSGSGIIAPEVGSQGWAAAVTELLRRQNFID